MIRVCIDPRSMTLWLDGHAGYAPEGQDIVCAAASMLAAALVEYVLDRVEPDDLGDCELRTGHARLDVHPAGDDAIRDCRCAFRMAETGFALLARQYPECVVVD